VGDLPIGRESFREVIARTVPAGKVDINLQAFDRGLETVRSSFNR
jgi:Pyruvate/2-oxoacid:ferredoxin oxidoreductase gamma subunit